MAQPAVTVFLMALIVTALYLADHPRLLGAHHTQLVHLDRAFTDPVALTDHLEGLLGGQVLRVHIRRLDLVSDTTTVEVHYRLVPAAPMSSTAGPADPAWSVTGLTSR